MGLSRKKIKMGAEAPKTNINTTVLDWQKAAMADGYKLPKYGADGDVMEVVTYIAE